MVFNEIFLSYSRRDGEFVAALHRELSKAFKEIWIDWEDIPPSATWWNEIEGAINHAGCFVAVLSPDYVASEICVKELELAESHGKKIVPVAFRGFELHNQLPSSIQQLNWLKVETNQSAAEVAENLVRTVNTNLEWTKFHTRLLVKAVEWKSNNGNAAYHLYGDDLKEALAKIEKHNQTIPLLNSLQKNFIEASKIGDKILIKKQLAGFYKAAIIYSLLQIVLLYFIMFDEFSETALVGLSWVWLPTLSFGLAGITIGKYSMKKSFIAVAVVCVLFFLFYAGLWASL